MKIIGGAAAMPPMLWPFGVHAQRERMRRIGFLWSTLPADDALGQAIGNVFVQGLQELGWSVGRNVHIDYRWGLNDVDRLRRSAEELVALAPDALFAAGNSAVVALQGATRNLPIIFANVADPVGSGYVDTLARPGGNITGFMNIEFAQGGKWLELLKQIAPHVTRVAVLRSLTGVAGPSTFAAIQAVAPLLGVEVSPINVIGEADTERAISNFARAPNGGLIVTFVTAAGGLRDLIPALAARHRLPAVYHLRDYVTRGGLSATILISLIYIGGRQGTSIASSKAKNRQTFQCRRRPNTRWCST